MATPIVNTNAVTDIGNRYNICQRSGRKAYPGELVKDPYTGAWVMPEYIDPYPHQLRVQATAELLRGAERPEQDDTFIDSITDPSDI